VAPETVRSQLTQVLAKTGLSRQAELDSLLAGLPTSVLVELFLNLDCHCYLFSRLGGGGRLDRY
jgi:hypothetical protein